MKLTYGALNLTAYPYAIEFGMDTGAPQNVTEALALLLQDGEVELSTRASNRSLGFNVLIEGANLLEMAENEAALIAESDRTLNLLTVDPDDGFGPPSVYQTFRAQVALARDDDMEMALLRRYTVSVNAAPFVRSAVETVTPALAASGTTTTLVDNGSSATGWTAAVNGSAVTPTVVSGAVKAVSPSLGGDVTVALTRTGAVTTSATKYLVVDWVAQVPGPDLRAFGDGIELLRLAQAPAPTAGSTRTWFGPVSASSIAVLRLESRSTAVGSDPSPFSVRSLSVDNINRTDIRPLLGSARQLLRSIAVGGSARTQGAIAIEHETDALGDVLAYFFPDAAATRGYVPCLRPDRVAGGPTVTTDAAMVSGARENITTGTTTFDIPCQRLPSGAFNLVIRALNTAVATLSWTAQTRIGGTAVGPALSGTFALPADGVGAVYEVTSIARPQLPPLDVDPAATGAVIRITMTATSASAVTLDEVWLFNTTIGQLSMVSCGTGSAASGGPARRLFIESPTVQTPRPTVRIGHAANRSDSFYPTDAFWQVPLFPPAGVIAFLVTTNALDAAETFRHFKCWHTNAAA